MYYVYRYMLGNKWIYVGKADASHTKNELQVRIKAHSKDERFLKYEQLKISYCILQNKSDMNAVESMLIKIKHPEINVVDRTNCKLPFILDNRNIKWIPIEEYSEIREKQLLPNVVDEKLFEFIKKKFAESKPSWYEANCMDDWYRGDIPHMVGVLLKNYFESYVDLCYPMCDSSFEVDISEIAVFCNYNKVVKPQTFSRLVKESLKRIQKQFDHSDEWWSIRARRKGEKIFFEVFHMYRSIRDYCCAIHSTLNNVPLCMEKGA